MHARSRLTVLCWAAALCAAAPAWAAPSAGARARVATDVDAGRCLELPGRPVPAVTAGCPGFLLDAVKEAATTCAEVGGRLIANPGGRALALDVNGDGRDEIAWDIGELVACEGAWSLFSCGSLGCPQALVQERDGAWQGIGVLATAYPERIEVQDGPAPGYRDLVADCLRGETCAERDVYQWDGDRYVAAYREVRGYRVDFGGAPEGLFAFARETVVRATPEPDAEVVGRYGPEAIVAIIGRTGDYYFVSPCNACESGFVPKGSMNLRTPGP